MTADNEYRDLVRKLSRERPRKAAPVSRFRESTDTMILAAVSIAIGLVVLVLAVPGTTRVPGLGSYSSPLADPNLTHNRWMACGLAAVVGEWLGIAGVILARSRGRMLSLLCLLGSVLCVVATVRSRLPLPMSEEIPQNITFLCLVIVPPFLLHRGLSMFKKNA